MPEIKLVAESRTQFGKGAARKIRRDHKIPAVLYGHGTAPVHITLPGHDTMMALKSANALLTSSSTGRASWRSPRTSSATRSSRSSSTSTSSSCAVTRRSPSTCRSRPRARPPRRPSSPSTRRPSSSRSRRRNIPQHVDRLRRGPEAGTQVLAGAARAARGRRAGHRRRDRWWSTSRSRCPPRRSRPSWPRPRPRPASSTTAAEDDRGPADGEASAEASSTDGAEASDES